MSQYLEPTKTTRSRARREPSGVFSLFQAAQIQQFKEAFQLIDVDKDGWVSEKDVLEIYENLGMPVRKQHLDELLNGPGGSQNRQGVNFTMFLTMMSEHLSAFDHDSELLEAFGCFDENDDGTVSIEEMHRWLGQFGERMNQEEIDTFLSGGFVDKNGRFNYREWVNLIRINESD